MHFCLGQRSTLYPLLSGLRRGSEPAGRDGTQGRPARGSFAA